jgi:hypothetical protein
LADADSAHAWSISLYWSSQYQEPSIE